MTTISAILALALGIGATTAMFGLVNAVLLRPLPFPDAERLVEIIGTVQRQEVERRGASYPDYFDWRDGTRSFDGMASWAAQARIVVGSGESVQVDTEVVDGPYFDLLGAQPLRGRLFDATDHRVGASPVAVISEAFAQRHYGEDVAVLGRSLQLNAGVFTVVGIVPSRFRGRSDEALVWTPAATTLPAQALAARGNRGFTIVARLKTGVTTEAAQRDVHAVSARLAREFAASNEARSAEVVPLADELFQNVRPAMRLLFAATCAVLLIACANVASLVLARSEGRQREMAVRRALGSSNRRLVQLMLMESAMLVGAGVSLGWLLSRWTGDALVALSPVQLPSFARPESDWRSLLFVATIGVLMTVALGLTPARSRRRDALAQSLRQGDVDARGGSHRATLRLILVGQVTVSVVLLVGAALLGRSFVALLNFDPGFEPSGVLSFRVQIPAAPVAPGASAAQADTDDVRPLALLEQIRSIAGTRQASVTTSVPLADGGAVFYVAEGMGAVDATNRPRAYIHLIAPGYFETLRMRMIEGRDFAPSDIGQNASVIVSESLAKRFWPGQSAIGRRIAAGGGAEPQWLSIVGVVGDANFRGVPHNPTLDPDLFMPFNQRARSFAVLLRTDGDPAQLMNAARAVVHRAEPAAAVFAEQTLSALVDNELGQAKFLSWLTGAFAVLALTLAVIGVYGTFWYWVRRRYTEIGIRSALGASQWRLLSIVVGQALWLAAAGAGAGLVLAAALTRYIETQLYTVRPLDAASFAGAMIVMLAAVAAASVAPAMRAARIDPARVLRSNA